MSNEKGASSAARNAALAMLMVAYAFNFIDRQILGILAGPIQADLKLDDAQMGWLGGFAFAFFYTLVAVPVAWAADRGSRSWIVAVSLAVWSGFTALCGLAGAYWQLLLARMGVGVGEAGGVAPSYALIADLYPAHQHARALAVFSLGIPIGSALGVLFGGLIAHAVDWRAAFVVVGLAGVAFAPIFKLVVKDPPAPAGRAPAPPLLAVFAELAAKPSFWFLSLGAGAASFVGYGLIFWLPSFLQRSFEMSLTDRTYFMAALLFFGGSVGLLMGGAIADTFGRNRRGAYAAAPAIAFVLTGICYALGLQAPTLQLAFVAFVVPQALGLAWIAPAAAAIQGLVAPRERAVASALFLLIVTFIGLGLGTTTIGIVSKALTAQFGAEALRYAILLSLPLYLVAAAMMSLAARTLPRDWREDDA